MIAGPTIEEDIWQYYQEKSPGEVVVLGADLFNGTSSSVANFAAQTGATFPLLLNAGQGIGNENLYIPYGDRDNYAVINKQGIVRYHAYDHYNYTMRFHVDELRATIDSLVAGFVGVSGPIDPRRFVLRAAPNPFRGATTIEVSNPSSADRFARVTVYDPAGRVVATLWSSPIPRGTTRIEWDGRSNGGSAVAPGIYLVRARMGREVLSRRVVRIE